MKHNMLIQKPTLFKSLQKDLRNLRMISHYILHHRYLLLCIILLCIIVVLMYQILINWFNGYSPITVFNKNIKNICKNILNESASNLPVESEIFPAMQKNTFIEMCEMIMRE
jgi:hypothetical protein